MFDPSIASLLPSYIQAVAIIATGAWAYRKFIYQRANEPATDIDIDLKFVGIQSGRWIIEITSFLKNQSLVRHRYRDFQVSVRYLLPKDPVKGGRDDIQYQLYFPNSIDDEIAPKKRYFANVDYLNPRQEFRHRYITAVPADATFVWVRCKFFFRLRGAEKEGTKGGIKVNSQRIFRVPANEDRRALATGSGVDKS